MFTKALLLGAIAVLVSAQSSSLSFTNVPGGITAGQASTLTFVASDPAPVTIILRKGAADNLDTVETLTDSATNGQYVWTPSTSLASGNDYALEITQNGEVNYFGPFPIQGGSASAVPSSYASSSASSSASNSASSSATASASTYSTSVLMSSTSTMSHTPYSTGMPHHYNSTNATMTSATVTRTTASSKPTNTDDLFNASSTGPDAAVSTGAAAMLGSSVIALVFGAAAAVLVG